ncbi:MAG: serine hydrolase [Verrucomicrobia bacterium]|nr:serine hydrolase [Verrucomicrobiota bacterium]MBI3869789.1 serine hydrolase [Verrucomicrobiota bacterium]
MKHIPLLLSSLLAAGRLLGGALLANAIASAGQPSAVRERPLPVPTASLALRPSEGAFVRRWLALGPLDTGSGETNVSGAGAQIQLMQMDSLAGVQGEAGVRPEPGAPAPIGKRTLRWRAIESTQDTIDLSALLGVKEPGVGYAWTEILAPRDLSVLMGLGTDGAAKVWLNGKLVHERRSARLLRKDDDLIPMRLDRGTNRLLLKIGSRPSGWSFCARFLNQAALNENLVNAAMNGAVDRMSLLLTNGGSVEARVGPGLTAWHAAKIRGQTEAAELMEKRGADAHRPFPNPGKTLDWFVTQTVPADAPGLALAVVQEGRVTFKKGWGMASLDYGVPITPSTVFHVASVSKQFTAFAIALLAQQGKLSVDDELRKHVPEIHDFGKPITLRHLLHHTSGLRDQWDLLVLAGWRMDDVITQEDILTTLRRQRSLNFDPGEEELYCNSGYTLLSEVVSRVSGKPFVEFTRDALFRPLEMTNTHFHLDHEEVVRNMAYSYSPSPGGGYLKSVLNYANVGATSLFTTVEDLGRWIANFEDLKVGGSELWRQMQEKGKLNNGKEINYGFGLAIGELRQTRMISHSGADAGYRSFLLWLPDHRLGVALLSNLGTMDVGRIAQTAAEIFLQGKLAPLAKRIERTSAKETAKPPFRVNSSLLERYAGRYRGASGRVISIVREGDALKGDISAGAQQHLTPSGEHEFFVAETQARVVFSKLDSGKAGQYTVHMDGETRVYQRIDPADEVSPRLADYAGQYRSDELAMNWEVQAQGSGLVIQHRRHGEIPLRWVGRDRFTASILGSLQFERDSTGKVATFKVTTGRVRDLRFDRSDR